MAKKIYLSPSDQVHNIYAYGNTNEAEQCRKIATACKAALERNGFAVKTDFQDGTNAMYQRVAQSNSWGADLHIWGVKKKKNAVAACGGAADIRRGQGDIALRLKPRHQDRRLLRA